MVVKYPMDNNHNLNVLIVGCGYTGRRIARLYQLDGATVYGIVSQPTSAELLQQHEIVPLQIDLDRPMTQVQWPEMLNDATIFYCAPPQAEGKDDNRIAAFLAAIKSWSPRCLIYLSTTGIYGDCRGSWVSERDQPAPLYPRAARRMAAENRLRRYHEQTQVPVTILRVAAIYGPGRLPVERIRAGQPILNENDSPFSNRIHVDDLAQICISAALRAKAWDVFNVSDGRPESMTAYFNRVADLAGLQRPQTITWSEAEHQLPPGMLEFLSESKRIDNARMLEELEVTLQYPDISSGLLASFASLDSLDILDS